MSDNTILRFQMNVIEEMALKFPDGKDVEGRYGPQVMFTIEHASAQTMYVPPIVATRIADLGIAPGERFQICKREKMDGRKKGVEWVIQRVDPPMQQQPRQPAHQAGRTPVMTAPAPVAVPRNGLSTGATATTPQNGTPHASAPARMPVASQQQAATTSNGNILRDFIAYNTAVMTGVLCASIDALENARKYAGTKNWKLEFNEEDVRATAMTLYIQQSRQGQYGREAA